MAVTLNVVRKGAEVFWTPGDSGVENVTIYAQGADGEWHNTDEIANDGKGELSYPGDFAGSSLVEVRDADGKVLDSGTVEIV